MTSDRGFALMLLAVNGTLMAGLYATARVSGVAGVSPLGMMAWQVLCASVLLTVIAALRHDLPELRSTHVRYAGIAGVLGITAPSAVTYSALQHLPTGTIGVIGALSPVFTYAIALACGLERPRAGRAAGIALGFTGVLAVVLQKEAASVGVALPWVAIAFAGPLMLAAGNVYRSRAWPAGLTPLAAATLMLALQAIVLVPAAMLSGHFVAPRAMPEPRDLALLGAGLMMTAFYLGAFELQRRAGPVLTGQLGSVITVASLLIGIIFLGERYPLFILPGVFVVLFGIALVSRGLEADRDANAKLEA